MVDLTLVDQMVTSTWSRVDCWLQGKLNQGSQVCGTNEGWLCPARHKWQEAFAVGWVISLTARLVTTAHPIPDTECVFSAAFVTSMTLVSHYQTVHVTAICNHIPSARNYVELHWKSIAPDLLTQTIYWKWKVGRLLFRLLHNLRLPVTSCSFTCLCA